ncbi:MAG: DHA2 family efflux MFS transporter permease subunit [Alphaproteobacteria bacterium]|nr:DHA2 family efflux MFS transporter permease subunit [Alphaproteobacteria bacterium]
MPSLPASESCWHLCCGRIGAGRADMTAAAEPLVVRDRFGSRVVTPGYRALVVIAALLASLDGGAAVTIVNVAVPNIMGTFGVGQDQAQYLATSFLATMTVGMLLTDWLVRAFGQRDVYLVSVAIFSAGCVVGGMADSFIVVVLGRCLQGVASGVLMPMSMITMFLVFRPEDRQKAIGLVGLTFTFGPGVGPWIGGVAVDAFDWRFTFFIVLPVLFASGVFAALALPGRDDSQTRKRFDWPGLALVSVFMGATLTGLSNGQLRGWNSDFVLVLLSIGGLSLAAFIVLELIASDPLLNIRIAVRRRFITAVVLTGMLGVGMFGTLYLLPIFLQLVQGFTPTHSGLVMLPGGLLLGVLVPLTGFYGHHVRSDWLVFTGFAISAVMIWFTGLFDANVGFWTVLLVIVAMRIGNSVIFPPLTVQVFDDLKPHEIGAANGALNFIRQAIGVFGLNLLALFLEQRTAFYGNAVAATQTERNFATGELLDRVGSLLDSHGLDEVTQGSAATWYLGKVLGAQATALAFRDTLFLLAGATAAAALLALTLRPRRKT